jgi:hypothetical protein
MRRAAIVRIFQQRHTSGLEPYCECCGHKDFDTLTVQHLQHNGEEHRRETGDGKSFYWWVVRQSDADLRAADLAVWCANCQAIDHRLGSCIHHNPDAERHWFHKQRQGARSQWIIQRENWELCIEHYSNGSHACTQCHWNESPYGLELDHIHNDGSAVARAMGRERALGAMALSSRLVEQFYRTGWPTGYTVLCSCCNHRKMKATRRQEATTKKRKHPRRKPVVTLLKSSGRRRSVYGKRLDRNGFNRYAIKDRQIAEFLASQARQDHQRSMLCRTLRYRGWRPMNYQRSAITAAA